MKILIIGGGGREHALAWKLSQSPLIKGIVATPGNPGIAQFATCVAAPENISDYPALAQAHGVNLTVVGPEAPLVAGIVDIFRRRRLWIVGPSKDAARLEGSKIFAKQFFERAGIPTAKSVQVSSPLLAVHELRKFSYPVVIKADGLAGGKGVVIAHDLAEAERAIAVLGPDLVIEEFLDGEEVSFIGLSNGSLFLPFAPTQDHKRIFDGDQGPNTGGMGAYCDGRILTSEQSGTIMDRIMLPAMARMMQERMPYTGFLYAGIMLTSSGPKVLEFNVRLGDPETQVLMHSYRGDFVELLNMAVTGEGRVISGRAWQGASVCVVLAAESYPGQARTDDPISGIEQAEQTGAVVFQAGTRQENGQLVTSGGRVLGVTAGGDTLQIAINRSYDAARRIHFAGMQYRTDIGQRGLKRWAEA